MENSCDSHQESRSKRSKMQPFAIQDILADGSLGTGVVSAPENWVTIGEGRQAGKSCVAWPASNVNYHQKNSTAPDFEDEDSWKSWECQVLHGPIDWPTCEKFVYQFVLANTTDEDTYVEKPSPRGTGPLAPPEPPQLRDEAFICWGEGEGGKTGPVSDFLEIWYQLPTAILNCTGLTLQE